MIIYFELQNKNRSDQDEDSEEEVKEPKKKSRKRSSSRDSVESRSLKHNKVTKVIEIPEEVNQSDISLELPDRRDELDLAAID